MTQPCPLFPFTCGRHHVSDVVGGAFLGTLVGAVYILRAIWRLDLVVLFPPALAPGVGCQATSDGFSAAAEPGASLLHGSGGARVYQDQISV